MYNILTLNKISKKGLNEFGSDYQYGDNIENPDAVLVRSTSMHEMEFPGNLAAIARAGAGVNNIPVDRCSEKGIVVFNTPGANANAVKELVLMGLFLSSRKIVPGLSFVSSLKGKGDEVAKMTEKGKSAFAGPEVLGKKLGVIGLGAIGILVANAATQLGMKVYGYDPYISVDAAWGLSSSVTHAHSLDMIFSECDYITIHVPLTPDTKEMINQESISKMKDGVRILNYSRANLVNAADIVSATQSGKVSCYVTDFPTDEILGVEGIVVLPHLGASTPESEDNCAFMAAHEIIDYLENGNIVNSVNLPNISMTREGRTRLCVLHKNVPNMISAISSVLSANGINIENMQSKSRNDYAYAMFDVSSDISDAVFSNIVSIEGVVRIRVIQ